MTCLVLMVCRAVPGLMGLLLLVPALLSGQTPVPPPPGDSLALQGALGGLRLVAEQGGWGSVPAGPTIRPGDDDLRLPLLRYRLARSGDLPIVWMWGGETTLGPELVEAVRRFQSRHGLDVDGIVGPATLGALNVPVEARIQQVELNLQRRREWLETGDSGRAGALGSRHVLVNVPGFEAWILEEGTAPVVHRVIVGRVDRATPLLEGRIERVALAPHWNVPWTIFVRDKLPALRRDPAYLTRQRMTVMDRLTGRPAVAGPPEWNRIDPGEFNDRFWLRQDPGPGNALGMVKFIFPNPYAVYLHDTPDRHLFQRGRRSFSSGCIRLDGALTLAERLLAGEAGWDVARIREVAGGSAETWVQLTDPVPIRLVYWTAWVDAGGVLHLNEDLYGLDARRGASGEAMPDTLEPAGDGGRETAGECR